MATVEATRRNPAPQPRCRQRRAAAAIGGIYGNDAFGATYPMTRIDTTGAPLDGGRHNRCGPMRVPQRSYTTDDRFR